MNEMSSRPGGQAKNDAILAEVALLYYKDGLTQDQIARRRGVSRATIVNYLREARERNIVEIRVRGEVFSRTQLSLDLRERLGLKDVYVVSASDEQDPVTTTRRTARIAAMALHDILEPGDRLGVPWGETVKMVSEEAPRNPISGLAVCQLVGSFHTRRVMAAEACAVGLANRLGADCYTLHAPAVLSSTELADTLRSEPAIREQLERIRTLDAVLFSVGDVQPSTLLVEAGMASVATLDKAVAEGAVAVLCGRFIDQNGNHVPTEIDPRLIAVELDTIGEAGKGIMVVSGMNKLDAALAALKGDYVSHLVIDAILGEALLARVEKAGLA